MRGVPRHTRAIPALAAQLPAHLPRHLHVPMAGARAERARPLPALSRTDRGHCGGRRAADPAAPERLDADGIHTASSAAHRPRRSPRRDPPRADSKADSKRLDGPPLQPPSRRHSRGRGGGRPTPLVLARAPQRVESSSHCVDSVCDFSFRRVECIDLIARSVC